MEESVLNWNMVIPGGWQAESSASYPNHTEIFSIYVDEYGIFKIGGVPFQLLDDTSHLPGFMSLKDAKDWCNDVEKKHIKSKEPPERDRVINDHDELARVELLHRRQLGKIARELTALRDTFEKLEKKEGNEPLRCSRMHFSDWKDWLDDLVVYCGKDLLEETVGD